MLEWMRERNQGWMAKIILTLVTVPFALFGINSYVNHSAGADVVATVDHDKIRLPEFEHALKMQQQQLQASLGAAASGLLDDPRMRMEVLQSLIRQHAMLSRAHDLGMVVSDRQLATFIGAIPAFQKDGKFDLETYRMMLRQQGLSIPEFERMARDDLLIQDLRAAFADAQQIPAASVDGFLQAYTQQRQVSTLTLALKDQPAAPAPDESRIETYYKTHQADFTVPERARFQYLVLSQDALAARIPVSDSAIQDYYNQNQAHAARPETRDARHILIPVTPKDDAAHHAAALKLAQDIEAQLKAHPDRFAALAKQYSGDPGSASQGGELGWFQRDAMVKPFADAAFSMKINQISQPVLSDFGYHIIQLSGIRPATTPDLASMRADIVATLQKQAAGKQYADAAERFSNQVFEQSADLSPTASALGLTVQTSGWMTRTGGDTPLLAQNDKMLQALFSSDVIKQHHNTAAIEVQPNVLVSAHLLQLEPARLQPLAEVRSHIVQTLESDDQKTRLTARGAAILVALRQGKEPAGLAWSAFQWVTRNHANDVPPDLVTPLFAADEHHLPAYFGESDAAGNFHLVRLTAVQPGPKPEEAKVKEMTSQLARMESQQVFDDYLASILAGMKVSINQKLLQSH